MASVYDPLRGFAVKHAFAKSVHKGEDAWSQKREVAAPAADAGPVPLDYFAVYDGHGGKQAATFASRHMLDTLLAELGRESLPVPQGGVAPAELEGCASILPDTWAAWRRQDALISGLPSALCSAFKATELAFSNSCKVSGTTATAVLVVGFELLVANVGDSCAYLDTGSEVLQVSGNHRLDDSRAEQERVRAAGCDVAPSTLEGKPVGPARVWPGGLAMSRTIGDLEAGEVVLSHPEVRQVTLPATGGRVIIASDGLWDAVAPKTAAHHVRGMPASKAATELVQAALKARGLRDDITVLVIDALPDGSARLPPLLTKNGSGQLEAAVHPANVVNIYHPLEDSEKAAGAWQHLVWERRLAAARAMWPAAFARVDESDRSEETGVESEGEGEENGLPASDPEWSDASEESDSSDASSTAHLGHRNPFALDILGTTDEEAVKDESWVTVPGKGRKHRMANSPQDTELSCTPPTPQAPALNAHGAEGPLNKVPGGRGRGVGGRGRAGGQRSRHKSSRSDGFGLPDASETQAPLPHQQPIADAHPGDAPPGFGLHFIEGGGFSLAAPAGHPGVPARGRGRGRGRGMVHVNGFAPVPRANMDAGTPADKPKDGGGKSTPRRWRGPRRGGGDHGGKGAGSGSRGNGGRGQRQGHWGKDEARKSEQ